jgi:predicted ABC-type ATPase
LSRIADRVRAGGHDIAETDVRRRFIRSWQNFQKDYKFLADDVRVFDVSGSNPIEMATEE